MYVRSSETRIMSVSVCRWHQNGRKEAEYGSHVEENYELCVHWRTSIISWPCAFGMLSAWMQTEWNNHWTINEDVWVTYFCWSNRKITRWEKPHAQTAAWSYDMGRHAQNALKYCELANEKTKQLDKVSSPCLNDHHLKQEELESVGELAGVCSQIVLTCLYLARIGRPDILWSVNKLARSVTKWIPTVLSCWKHGTALFAGDLGDSKSTSGGVLCIFGSRTCVPVSWMCKKQTSVPHSSTESEIISLDVGFRLERLPALDLWDMAIEVLRSINNKVQPKHTSHQETGAVLDSKTKAQHVKRRQKVEVDWVPTNTHSSQGESQLFIFEDNEAVIKMIIKGRRKSDDETCVQNPPSCSWLVVWHNQFGTQNSNHFVDTKNQLADILTKGSFSKNEWNYLLCLLKKWSSRCILVAISKAFSLRLESALWLVPCRHEDRTRLRTMAHRQQEARPVNLVMRSQCKEETSSSSLESRVNPVNDDERKRVGQAPGNWMLGDSKSEVENSQVSRQEKVPQAARKLQQKDQTQIKSEENPPGTRKLAACSPEFRNMEYTNHRFMDKIFQKLEKKLGMSAINATFSMDAYKTNVLTWGLFSASSMKAAIHLGPDFLMNSEIYKNTKIRKFNITRKLTKEHSEGILIVECLDIFITVMDEINMGQWSSVQVGDCKSMCLRWFRSLCRTGERYFRSNRKVERPSWRSHEVFVLPRCSGTWRRTDSIRVEKSQDFRTYHREHQARRLQGPDHLHVNVQRHWVEKEWWKMCFECRRCQEITPWNSCNRIGRKVVWRFPRS